MNLQNKHIATYGKKITPCNFRYYHTVDNFLHKSRITAIAVTVIQ